MSAHKLASYLFSSGFDDKSFRLLTTSSADAIGAFIFKSNLLEEDIKTIS
jgi:hypothetical protein